LLSRVVARRADEDLRSPTPDAAPLRPPAARLARQPSDTIEVELIASRDEYRLPGGNEVYRVGDEY
jgi:hypothetical protein